MLNKQKNNSLVRLKEAYNKVSPVSADGLTTVEPLSDRKTLCWFPHMNRPTV